MRLTAIVALCIGLAGCVTPSPASRVDHVLDPRFWRAPPHCAVVLPAGVRGEVRTRAAERALARHLSGRVDAVIGPDRRDATLRRLGLDLGHPPDRRVFAAASGCRHGVELMLAGGRAFALIWAEARMDLEARMIDLEDGEVMWRARHRASRATGGLPTSPLGLLVSVGRAGTFAADADLVPSVLDDGLRALIATLPDTRRYTVSAR